MTRGEVASLVNTAVGKAASAREQANGDKQIEYLADAIRELARAVEQLNQRRD